MLSNSSAGEQGSARDELKPTSDRETIVLKVQQSTENRFSQDEDIPDDEDNETEHVTGRVSNDPAAGSGTGALN